MRSIATVLLAVTGFVMAAAGVNPVAPSTVSLDLLELTPENFDETISAHSNVLVEV